jgi:hypothetical protein
MRTTWHAATVCVASRRTERTIHDAHPAPASGVDPDDATAGSAGTDATALGTGTTAGAATGAAGVHAIADAVTIPTGT